MGWNSVNTQSALETSLSDLDPIHTDRERCCLENGYGTHVQVASLAVTLVASLGVNGAIETHVFFPSIASSGNASGNSLSFGVNRPLSSRTFKVNVRNVPIGHF